jgi:2-methylisocitrate lyase-like PEP mutase family enzyme
VESKIDARLMEDILCVPTTTVARMSITGTEESGADVLYMEGLRSAPMKAVKIPSNIWMVVPVASVSLTEATLGVPSWVVRPLPLTE